MGYKVVGKCFPDAASALTAWQGTFPTITGSPPTMAWHISSIVNPTGLVTYSVAYRQFSTTVITNSIASTMQLPVCTQDLTNYVFDKYPVQDIVYVVALAMAVFFGFVSGRMR
ncbi:MAG: hypothetical protein HOO97_06250 [Sideroxydans sp.]|nr:hypothetical protein [Sideroxydans sp.]